MLFDSTKLTEEMVKEQGYRKVAEDGGTLVVGIFWNPVTKDEQRVVERDYDYDATYDRDWAYYMPIDKEARRAWLHEDGVILEGDTVEVFKGRKIPVGTVAKVVSFQKWKDQYGRLQTVYAVFEDGRRTSVSNCRLIREV